MKRRMGFVERREMAEAKRKEKESLRTHVVVFGMFGGLVAWCLWLMAIALG